MKIAFVTSSLGAGGAERVASILANEWANLGHEVTFYCVHSFDKPVYPIDEKVQIKKLREQTGKGYFKLIKNLRKSIKEDHNDIIVSLMTTPGFYAYLASKKAKLPFVCSERNNPYLFPNSKLKRMIRNHVFKKANHVVFQTEDAQKFFSKKIQNKSSVLFNPCDLNMPIREKKVEKVVVSAGRLNYQKDFGTLIKAFALFSKDYPEYKLHIYGDGEEKDILISLISELGIKERAEILPFSNEIRNIIARSGVFVSSSLFEGMPNVLIEALAIGTPSIASDCPIGGSRLLMNGNKFGKLFEVGNVEQLSDALKEIAKQYEFYYNGSLEFSETIRCNLNSTKIAKEWIEIFERILKR